VKTHARNFTIGAVLTPLALALATLIANEAQTLLGLHLDRVALSIYLFPFLAGAAAVIAALVRLEATKVGGELGSAIGDLASTMFGPPGAETQTIEPAPVGQPTPPDLPPPATPPAP
jgi:predicted membrane protein